MKISKLNEEKLLRYIRNICNETEQQFLTIQNGGQRHDITASYRYQWRILTDNLKDDNNPDLRRNTLAGNFTPIEMANSTDRAFFSNRKKAQLAENEYMYLMAQKAPEKIIQIKPDDEIHTFPKFLEEPS